MADRILTTEELYRQARSVPAKFTKAEISRWNDSKGRITQTVVGNKVDIWVSLGTSAMTRLWWFLVIAGGAGVLFIFSRIVQAIITGRVDQILHHAGMWVR